jgi:hypothetical protein
VAPFMDWVRYFIGTPQRATRTMIGIALITVLYNPALLVKALGGVMAAVQPLIGPVLSLLIVLAGLRFILQGIGRPR